MEIQGKLRQRLAFPCLALLALPPRAISGGPPPSLWAPPALETLGEDAQSQLIRYGHALVVDTANRIGPRVSNPAKRYSGNNLACQSCHLRAGTQPFAMPLVGAWGQYPQYREREGRMGTLEERIDGCLERSMNGRALPHDGPEMKALLAYVQWLSRPVPEGVRPVGAGIKAVPELRRAADPARGRRIYSQNCVACHGANGQGQRAPAGFGYLYPPLWGADSYNNGAGMSRLLSAAAFIANNMPFGTSYEKPLLSARDAYDAAAYINGKKRPRKAELEKDYPIRSQKPVDIPYGPYADEFSADQHRLGPFGPMRKATRGKVSP